MSTTVTILERLKQVYPDVKMTTLREWISGHRVFADGTLVRSLKQPVAIGARVDLDAPKTTEQVLQHGLEVVYQDSDIFVVEKPSGLLTATDAEERRPTVSAIMHKWSARDNHKGRAFIVHRLDRGASGLLVLARNPVALAELKQQFFVHSVTRQYHAVVIGKPPAPAGKLESLLWEDHLGHMQIVDDPARGQQAITHYRVLKQLSGDRTLVECTLETGRKHQIRAQLAKLGCPILGDGEYGPLRHPKQRLMLHAVVLELDHPKLNKRLRFESPSGFC